MRISACTLPELELYREMCNFTPEESMLFEARAEGQTLESCCEILHMEMTGVKRVSAKVRAKMDFIGQTVDIKKWINQRF